MAGMRPFGSFRQPVIAGPHALSTSLATSLPAKPASVTDLDPFTKIVLIDDFEEEVPETFDATGNQSNSGKYHKYEGFFTDELSIDRFATLLIDKNFEVL
jgi:hypothetical protein